jgi:hypothetical protein
MASNLDRRTRTLEALPAPAMVVSPEASHQHMLEVAAARGLTESDVEARYGGTSGLAVFLLLESANSERAAAEWEARVAKHGGDDMAAILELARRPAP